MQLRMNTVSLRTKPKFIYFFGGQEVHLLHRN